MALAPRGRWRLGDGMKRMQRAFATLLAGLFPVAFPSAAESTAPNATVGAAPAAAGAQVAFKQVRVGKAVVSLPAGWHARSEDAVPVWLHLHGAPATVEAGFAAIGAPGVLVNVTLPGLSKVYADHFAGPEVFGELLRATEAVLRAERPERTWTAGALTVSSFSAGFGGVRQLLRQPAAAGRIGTLVMADSIYCGYAGDPKERRVDPELMAGFLAYARRAAAGEARLLITHTEQVPDGYGSTTETADYLIAQLGGRRSAEERAWSPKLRQTSRFAAGGCEIVGFAGAAADDHMQHLRGIGLWLERVRGK